MSVLFFRPFTHRFNSLDNEFNLVSKILTFQAGIEGFETGLREEIAWCSGWKKMFCKEMEMWCKSGKTCLFGVG